MKNLSIQTKNILKTKRSRSETNRWLPTNQDFRKILKPLPKKPTSPPVTNKMTKRWSDFYLKNSSSEHQSARFENLLNKDEINVIDENDDRIKLKMIDDDDKKQFDSNLPIFQRTLNVGTSCKKTSLLTDNDLKAITKNFDNDEKRSFY